VAELVDAQVSEACCRKAVEVRFFSSAPQIKRHLFLEDKGRKSFILFILRSFPYKAREMLWNVPQVFHLPQSPYLLLPVAKAY
jgi:hypothetical protein